MASVTKSVEILSTFDRKQIGLQLSDNTLIMFFFSVETLSVYPIFACRLFDDDNIDLYRTVYQTSLLRICR